MPRYDNHYDWYDDDSYGRYDNRYDRYDCSGRHGSNTKLYVGQISSRTRTEDLEDLFSNYGRVKHVDLKRDFGFVVPRGPGGRREYMGRGPPPVSGPCFNCGIDGHWARDCEAGNWKNKCYRCGEDGHIQRNCQNSKKDLKRGRSYSRSPSPRRGEDRSRNYGRSRSRSRQSLSPRKDNRGADHRELLPRSYSGSPRSPSPRARAEHNGSYHGGSPQAR